MWALRRRPINQIDRWDGATYRRTLYVEDVPVEMVMMQLGDADLLLRLSKEMVEVRGLLASTGAAAQARVAAGALQLSAESQHETRPEWTIRRVVPVFPMGLSFFVLP